MRLQIELIIRGFFGVDLNFLTRFVALGRDVIACVIHYYTVDRKGSMHAMRWTRWITGDLVFSNWTILRVRREGEPINQFKSSITAYGKSVAAGDRWILWHDHGFITGHGDRIWPSEYLGCSTRNCFDEEGVCG